MSNPTLYHEPGIASELGYGSYQLISQVITVADLTAEAAAENIAITGFPAKAMKIAAWIELKEVFAGGSAESATVQIGDAGDPDELMVATSVFTGVSPAILGGQGAAKGWSFEAAYAPVARFTVTGSGINVDDLTTGSLIAHVLCFVPGAL